MAPSRVIGALRRAKRANVMGAPGQRSEAVCISAGLSNAIAGHFDVDPARFMAPFASAQALAVAASAYGGTTALEIPVCASDSSSDR